MSKKLIAILYHLQIMNPIFPDAQPWESYSFAIAAVVIVFLNRRQMFQRGEEITGVLILEEKSVPSE